MSVRQDKEFTGLDGFVWFFGIVEDRYDPLNVGRVRVRCYGWHTENKTDLPTESLPWAQVMMPITSASISSIGTSATGLVEGTLVVGFFLDGKNAQQPIIMGSVPGIPERGSGRGETGFVDPEAKYPLSSEVGKPDTPRLAYDRWTEDKITTDKDSNRVKDVPTAQGPALSKTSRTPAIESTTWEEPKQRGGDSAYPFNHVRQTEGGHAFEVDDTVGCERIHQYHAAGTFYEIQADGKRITKVVGDDFEIFVKNKNVSITGSCNITVNGNSTLLVKGNLIEEVNGDYHLTVHGSRLTKIDGNDCLEVGTSRSESIGTDDTLFVNDNKTTTIGKNASVSVGKSYAETIKENKTSTVIKTNNSVAEAQGIYSTKDSNFGAGQSLNIGATSKVAVRALTQILLQSTASTEMTASILNVNNDQHITGTSTATVDHVSNGTSGHNHTHTDTIGLGAGTTSPPN